MRRLVFIILLALPLVSLAENGHKKGLVQHIRVHDAKAHPAWAPPTFWFTLEGVTSAGSCNTWHGNVLFAMDSEAALSIVLSAQMAGREISVRYDDSVLHVDNFWCKATYVTTGKPAPLY